MIDEAERSAALGLTVLPVFTILNSKRVAPKRIKRAISLESVPGIARVALRDGDFDASTTVVRGNRLACPRGRTGPGPVHVRRPSAWIDRHSDLAIRRRRESPRRSGIPDGPGKRQGQRKGAQGQDPASRRAAGCLCPG